MKILSVIFCLCTLCNVSTKPAIDPEVKRLSYDVPLTTMNIPDEALIGDITKTTLKYLGMPDKSAMQDYTIFNDSTSFDFMGFHYERADNGDGTYGNPNRTNLTYETYPECVYLGPVHREDESETTAYNNDYSAYVGVKTAFVYSRDYTNQIHTFPDLENIILLSPYFKPTIRLPDKLKNIYINPFLGNLAYYWANGGEFDTSYFDHKVNIVVSEYDKLAALKLHNSLDRQTVDPATWIKPNLYYIDDSEKYCENSIQNEYYEYGGFFYCNSKGIDIVNSRIEHALFPGKYVTKGIFHPGKVGINSQTMEINFTDKEKIYFEELYINTSSSYTVQHFKGNSIYIMGSTSGIDAEHFKGFKNIYVKKSSSTAYHLSNESKFAEYGITFYVPTHNCDSGFDTYKYIEALGEGAYVYYDTSTVNLTLQVQNKELTYTTIGPDLSYANAIQYVIINEPDIEDNVNDEVPNKDDQTLTKAAQAAITIFGSVSGFILIYYIYKYVKRFIRWLRN